MLVSHRYNFIYTKTSKTGGTSVESYFERFCMLDGEWTQSHAREEYISQSGIIGYRGPKRPDNCKFWNHMPAAQIKEKVGGEVWDKYFKFCVIRNPYDKVVSAFYFFQQASNNTNEFSDLKQERAKFEKWLRNGKQQIPVDRDKYIINNKFCLDEVLRYEVLTADLEKVCARLGVPWEPALLPAFKAGVRPKNAITQDLYTEKSKKIVADAFAFEIEHFNYSFPA